MEDIIVAVERKVAFRKLKVDWTLNDWMASE